MPVSGPTIIAILALFWGLVVIWMYTGLLTVILLAAVAELAIVLRSRFAARRRAVDIRHGDRS